jgi:hypothetical protein
LDCEADLPRLGTHVVHGDTGGLGHFLACIGTVGVHTRAEREAGARRDQHRHSTVAVLDGG